MSMEIDEGAETGKDIRVALNSKKENYFASAIPASWALDKQGTIVSLQEILYPTQTSTDRNDIRSRHDF